MRKFVAATLVAAVLMLATRAEAAFVPVVATVVGQPVIDGLGISYIVGGGATIDTSGPFPVVTVPVDTVTPNGTGFILTSSAFAAAIVPGLTSGVTLSSPVLDTLLGTLTALVEAPDFGFAETLVVASLAAGGDLAISADAADLLAVLGIRGAEGFVIANIVFDPTAIPVPASVALFGLALLGLAAARRVPLRAA